MRRVIKLILAIFVVTSFISCSKSREEQFNYQKPEVKNGKIKAVIEIGSSGFSLFVINIDKDKNWELKKAEWGKKSEIYDSNATIKKIEDGIKDYMRHIAEYKTDDIHFVISSGARKAKITETIVEVLSKNYKNIKVVSAKEEAKYGYLSVVPKKYQKESFLIDIGSGNTKIAWLERDGIKTLEGDGSKAYKLNRSLEEVYNNIKTLSEDIPKNVTKRAFFIGGIAYKLAKNIRKDKEDYTILLPYNIYSKDTIKKTKMKYGVEIYKAITQTTKTKTFIFPWNGNFAVGYLISLPY